MGSVLIIPDKTPLYCNIIKRIILNFKVFGSVNLVQILFIPLFGKYLDKLKAYRLFLFGVCICGAANIAFGL